MQRALWEVGNPIETPGNSELRVNVCLFFLSTLSLTGPDRL